MIGFVLYRPYRFTRMVAILFHTKLVDRSIIDKSYTPSYSKVLQHYEELCCIFEKFFRV